MPNQKRSLPKRPVMQAHGITLSFHREVADSSRELVGPDIAAAVGFESYPRFIKGSFQDYEGLDQKIHWRFQARSLRTIEVARRDEKGSDLNVRKPVHLREDWAHA